MSFSRLNIESRRSSSKVVAKNQIKSSFILIKSHMQDPLIGKRIVVPVSLVIRTIVAGVVSIAIVIRHRCNEKINKFMLIRTNRSVQKSIF